jgi:hypothetical protein
MLARMIPCDGWAARALADSWTANRDEKSTIGNGIAALVLVIVLCTQMGTGAAAAGDRPDPQSIGGDSRGDGKGGESLPDSVPSLSKKLAETGGILMPPEHGRLIIINPPDTGPNSMPTRPDIGPRARSGESSMPSARKGESSSVDPGQM